MKEPILHVLRRAIDRDALEGCLASSESNTIDDDALSRQVQVQTIQNMSVGADLKRQTPLVSPLARERRTLGFVLKGKQAIVLQVLTHRVHAKDDGARRVNCYASSNFCVKRFEGREITTIMLAVCDQGLEGICRSFGLEQFVRFFRETLAVTREEFVESFENRMLTVAVQQEVFHSFMPRLAEDQMVVGTVRTPAKHISEKILPGAIQKSVDFGRVHRLQCGADVERRAGNELLVNSFEHFKAPEVKNLRVFRGTPTSHVAVLA